MGGTGRRGARRNGVRITAMAMLIGFLAVGCGDEGPTGPTTAEFDRERDRVAKTAPKDPKAAKKAAVKAKTKEAKRAAQNAPADGGLGLYAGDFSYDPTGKRDPFRSYEWERPDRIDDAELRGPLEQYDVSQLDVVAVVWKTGNARALVQDPSGQSYIIAEGTRIGKNDGHVIAIEDNLVMVKETYVDFLGQETTKDIEMRIRRSEGG